MDGAAARTLLLEACDRLRREVLAQDYGVSLPPRGKLIREGLRNAREMLESLPAEQPARDYLAAARRILTRLLERKTADPISEDGWRDEDGAVTGGIASVLREVARLEADLPPAG
jgi:hypothetical protein